MTGDDAMNQQIERREAERRVSDEDLSPEYLAVLEVCGGEIRAADRAGLAERRRTQADGQPGEVDAKAVPEAALPAPRRSSETVPAATDRRRREAREG
jgi:hypothetical protein